MGKKKSDVGELPPYEDHDKGGPSKANSGCKLDAHIRSFGWQIVSRPCEDEAWWSRNGVLSPQSVVLKLILMEESLLEG